MPLRDVAALGNDGLACSALPAHSLDGAFALVQRGTCPFAAKVANAQSAGASGAIFYMADQSALISPGGLSSFAIPAVMISNAAGLALKDYVQTNPGGAVTIDPNGAEQDAQGYDQLAAFSSLGPATGASAVKPELVAPGTSIYMAAESDDPLGIIYSSNRFAAANGTSFSAPIVAGAAALVKQSHPDFQAADIRSALVNTASQAIKTDQAGNTVDVQWLGAGKLDAGAAAGTTVTSDPATLSFGVLTSLPQTQQLQIKNSGPGTVTLSLGVVQGSTASSASLKLDKQSLSLGPGESGAVTATLSGSKPVAGSYSGAITVQAANVSLRIPYLYLVGNGVAANIIPLTGSGFDGTVGQPIPDGIMSFKLVDAFGVPVTGARVSWAVQNGGAIVGADSTTDAYGIAGGPTGSRFATWNVQLPCGGRRPHGEVFRDGTAAAEHFSKRRRELGQLRRDAPGGSGVVHQHFRNRPQRHHRLRDHFRTAAGNRLRDGELRRAVGGISVPGRLIYVSPTQINLQVPWELQGQSSAQVKVTINLSNGNVVTVPLSDYAPAFFEASPGQVAAQDAGFQAIGSTNPVGHGQVVILYLNGLGPVNNQPASGEPQAPIPCPRTLTTPVVTIGGQNADVQFSGLTPGLPGLYQINAVVPASLASRQLPHHGFNRRGDLTGIEHLGKVTPSDQIQALHQAMRDQALQRGRAACPPWSGPPAGNGGIPAAARSA